MKSEIANPDWSYSSVDGKGKIHFMATVQFVAEESDAGMTPGDVIHSDNIGVTRFIDDPTDWFPAIKSDLKAQKDEIVTQFNTNITTILTKTGKTSIPDIIADIVTYVEGA